MSVGVLSGFKEVFNLHYNSFNRIEMDSVPNSNESQSESEKHNHCRSDALIGGDVKDDENKMTADRRSDKQMADAVVPECTINLSGRGFTGSVNMTLDPHLEFILLSALRRFAEIISDGTPQGPDADVGDTELKEIVKSGMPVSEKSAENLKNCTEVQAEVNLFHSGTQTSRQFVGSIVPSLNQTSYPELPSTSSHVPLLETITQKQSSRDLVPLIGKITPKLSSRNLDSSGLSLTLERHQGFDTVKSSATDNLSSRPNLMFNRETKVEQTRSGDASEVLKYRGTTTDSSSQFHCYSLPKRKRRRRKIENTKVIKPESKKSRQSQIDFRKPANSVREIVSLKSLSPHVKELKSDSQQMTNSNKPEFSDKSLNVADQESFVNYKNILMHYTPRSDSKTSSANQSKRFISDTHYRKEVPPIKIHLSNKERQKDSKVFIKQRKQSNTTSKYKLSNNLQCSKYKKNPVPQLNVLNHEKSTHSISNKKNINTNIACTAIDAINYEDVLKCEKLQKTLSNLIKMFDCLTEKVSADSLRAIENREEKLERRNLATRVVDMDNINFYNYQTKSVKDNVLPKPIRSVVKWFGKLQKVGNLLVGTANKHKYNKRKSKTNGTHAFKFFFKNKKKCSILPSTVQMLKSDVQFYSMSNGWRQDRHSFQRDKSPRHPRRERDRARGEDGRRRNLDDYCKENCPKVCRDYFIRMGREMSKRRRRSSSADVYYNPRYRANSRFAYYHTDDSSSHYDLNYDARPRREHHRKMSLIRYHPEFSSSQDSYSNFYSSSQDDETSEFYRGSHDYRSDPSAIRRSVDAEVQTEKKKVSSGQSSSNSSKSNLCKYKLKRCSHRRNKRDASFASCICKKTTCCGYRKKPKPDSSKRLRWKDRSKRFSCCLKNRDSKKSRLCLKDDSSVETSLSKDLDKASDKTSKSLTQKIVGNLFKKSKQRKTKNDDAPRKNDLKISHSKPNKSKSEKYSMPVDSDPREYEVNIALGVDTISDDSLEEPKSNNILPNENKEQLNSFLEDKAYDVMSPFKAKQSNNSLDYLKENAPTDPTASRGKTIQKKVKNVKQYFMNKFKTLTNRKTSSVEIINSPFIYREETQYDYNQNQERKRSGERHRESPRVSQPFTPNDTNPHYQSSIGQESRPRYSTSPDHQYSYYRRDPIDMPPMNPQVYYDRYNYDPRTSNFPVHYNQFSDHRRSHEAQRCSPDPSSKVRSRDICHKCKIKSGEPLSEILIRRSKSPHKHNENVVRAKRVILEDFPSKQFVDVGTQYDSDVFLNVDRILDDECFGTKRRTRNGSVCKDKPIKRKSKEKAMGLPRPSPPRDPKEDKRNSLILFQDRNTYLLKPAEVKQKHKSNKPLSFVPKINYKKKESTPSTTTLCSTQTTIDTCSTSTVLTPKKKKRQKYKSSSSDPCLLVKTKRPPKTNKKKLKSKKRQNSISKYNSSESCVVVKQKKKSKDRHRCKGDECTDRTKPYIYNCIKSNKCVPEKISLLNDALLRNNTYSTARNNNLNSPTIQEDIHAIRQRAYTWKNNQCLTRKGFAEPDDSKRNPTVNVALLKTKSREIFEMGTLKKMTEERKCVENSEILIDKYGLPLHNKTDAETSKTLNGTIPKSGADNEILSDECQHFQKILNVTKIINRMKNIQCTQESKKNQRSDDT